MCLFAISLSTAAVVHRANPIHWLWRDLISCLPHTPTHTSLVILLLVSILQYLELSEILILIFFSFKKFPNVCWQNMTILLLNCFTVHILTFVLFFFSLLKQLHSSLKSRSFTRPVAITQQKFLLSITSSLGCRYLRSLSVRECANQLIIVLS